MGERVIYRFTVSDGGRGLFDLSLADLERTGNKFKPMGHCAGLIEFDGVQTSVVCDAPAISIGNDSKPVVMDLSGKRSS